MRDAQERQATFANPCVQHGFSRLVRQEFCQLYQLSRDAMLSVLPGERRALVDARDHRLRIRRDADRNGQAETRFYLLHSQSASGALLIQDEHDPLLLEPESLDEFQEPFGLFDGRHFERQNPNQRRGDIRTSQRDVIIPTTSVDDDEVSTTPEFCQHFLYTLSADPFCVLELRRGEHDSNLTDMTGHELVDEFAIEWTSEPRQIRPGTVRREIEKDGNVSAHEVGID